MITKYLLPRKRLSGKHLLEKPNNSNATLRYTINRLMDETCSMLDESEVRGNAASQTWFSDWVVFKEWIVGSKQAILASNQAKARLAEAGSTNPRLNSTEVLSNMIISSLGNPRSANKKPLDREGEYILGKASCVP